MDSNQIEHLISKKLTEGLTAREQEVLNEWLNISKDNQSEYEAYVSLWEKSQKLVLSDEIDVEASLIRTKKRLNFNRKKNWLVFARQVAAVLAISILLSSLYNYYQNDWSFSSNRQTTQEIRAAYGTHVKVELPDGTYVWLNSGSTIKFPNSFDRLDKRMVKLDGEAYFEVTKDKRKPFIVNTSKLDVKVYGTSFTVTAYDDAEEMIVALVEGKVSIEKQVESQLNELFVMKPNDVVEYNAENKKIYHHVETHMDKFLSWKDGSISFYNDPIDVVVRRMSKWYNVEITVDDKELEKYRFTATFSNESLEQVLNLLSISSSMKYEIQQAEKLSNGLYSSRKVVLKAK